jgi:hypothetical protein
MTALALLGFLFAQIAAAAYACTTEPLSHSLPVVPISEQAAAMVTHCAEMGGARVSNPSLCHAHCRADSQLDTQPQALEAPTSILPPLTLSLSSVGLRREVSSLRVLSAAPHPSILFGRLLI